MRMRSAGWMTGLVIAGLMVYGCVTLLHTRAKVTEAARTEAQLQAQIAEIQEENAALQYAIENQDDPATIEDIARDKLGLVMPDEQIFYDSGE